MTVAGRHLTWMWLVVLAFTSFRVTRFVVADDFPGWAPVRARITRRWPPTPGAWSELLVCPWCMGVWVSAGVVTWWLLAPAVLAPVAVVLAVAATVGLLAEWGGG